MKLLQELLAVVGVLALALVSTVVIVALLFGAYCYFAPQVGLSECQLPSLNLFQAAAVSAPPGLVAEGEFPGTATGPGYAEWWNEETNDCGIVFLDDGVSFRYDHSGHWWRLESLRLARSLFPGHRDAFLEVYPHCVVGLPSQTPDTDLSMGPVVAEGEFPGTARGPGYAEWDDGINCGIAFLGEGDSLTFDSGHWWRFDSLQQARGHFSGHMISFLDEYPHCAVGMPLQADYSAELDLGIERPPAPDEELPTTITQGTCPEEGTVAWQQDNLPRGETYDEGIISGESETCWIVGQLWTNSPQNERWIFAIRPRYGIRIAGHRSGTAWFFGGSEEEAMADLRKQAREVIDRDPPMRTHEVVIPDDTFRLVTEVFGAGIAPSPAEEEPEVVEPTPVPTEVPVLVTEGVFPGVVTGPAIGQWYLSATGQCGIFRLEEGEELNLPDGEGQWWEFSTQEAMENRWDDHLADFRAAYPECPVGRPPQ